jgi:hypothetical protein
MTSKPSATSVSAAARGLHDVGVERARIAEHFELHQLVAVEQFARQAAGAHRLVGGVAARGVGQQGELVGREHVQQVRLAGRLPEVGAPDRDGDDLRARGLGGPAGFVEILELARAGEQAGTITAARDDQAVVGREDEGVLHVRMVPPFVGRSAPDIAIRAESRRR